MKRADLDSHAVRVSVVVPVYEAMPYLKELLRSLLDQDLPPERYEIIAIDDGSTDRGPKVLDRLARRHPQLRVVHQENSGWPGIPRNRGLDMARGDYVFFADADDKLGPEALRRMVDFADQHGSDVVVPKMVGTGGRWVRESVYNETQLDADLERVFKTLTPQKLFRRSLLLEHGIRFPHEKVRLEDGMFVAQAYYQAGRVSVFADYDCYYLNARADGKNISGQRIDPEGYTWSVAEVSRIVRENDPDQERAGRIIVDLFRRKCLKFYEPVRFLGLSEERRLAFITAHQAFVREWIPQLWEGTLDTANRRRTALIRGGDDEGLLAQARKELHQPLSGALLAGGSWRPSGELELSLEFHGGWSEGKAEPLILEVRRRESETVEEVRVQPRTTARLESSKTNVTRGTVVLPANLFNGERRSVLDLRIRVRDSAERARVAAPLLSLIPEVRGGVHPYATVQGNFSIEVTQSAGTAGPDSS